MDKENINDYKLKLKTEQAGAFRILVEALKEILTEANFKPLMNLVLSLWLWIQLILF